MDMDAVHTADESYAISLGWFVIIWADTETELGRVLRHYAGVSNAVARALFSGTRAKAMMDFVNSIAHNLQLDPVRVADLKFVFAQLGAINDARNKFVHHSSESMGFKRDDPSIRLLSDLDRTSRYGNGYAMEVSSATLDGMVFDLHGIRNHLERHWNPALVSFSPWEEDPGVRTTWRYRPPPQVNSTTNRPPKTPKPARPPKPLRAKRLVE